MGVFYGGIWSAEPKYVWANVTSFSSFFNISHFTTQLKLIFSISPPFHHSIIQEPIIVDIIRESLSSTSKSTIMNPTSSPSASGHSTYGSSCVPSQRVFSVQDRIKTLEQYLDPSSPLYEREGQHTNIRAVIRMYKSGELVDHSKNTYLVDGKVMSRDAALECSGWTWIEVRSSNSCKDLIRLTDVEIQGKFYQLANREAYGHP